MAVGRLQHNHRLRGINRASLTYRALRANGAECPVSLGVSGMSYRAFVFGATAVLLFGTGRGVLAAPTSSVDPIFVPAVRIADTLRYAETDRLTGAIKHTHMISTTY